jgi:phospholipid/cholesterol/gamma-HCH transport system permease protein
MGLAGRFIEWAERHCQGAGYTLTVLFGAGGQLSGAWRKRGEIVRQLDRVVFGSLFVTFIVALFTGMILALQSGIELSRWQLEANVGLLVSASMVREMGPVMAAFILAGLVGSTMAAELGTMKVSEEIDALEVMSINPLRFLVMPRVVALGVGCPVLVIFVDAVGVAGGGVVARSLLGVDYALYFDKARNVLEVKDLLGGLLKSFLFGVTISTIGCAQGLRAENGAEGVGRATMRAVVMSFIYVLILDYFVAWMLY